MNYKESGEILKEINKAKRILLKVHRSPDPDSICSCLSLYYILRNLKKDAKIISSDEIHRNFRFLPNANSIEKVDMSDFDYSKFDLFIVLDSSSIDQATGIKDAKLPEIPMIVIDHHKTNERYGKINLVDYLGSTCEVLYNLFRDINFEIDKDLATYLLMGIIADTGSFQYDYTTPESLEIASDLIRKGADRQEIIFNLYNSYDYDLVKFLGLILSKMQFDREHHFVWVAVPFLTYDNYHQPEGVKSMAASLFFRSVEGADFGMVLIEQEKGILNMSFRSRKSVDVSAIAKELGGSGHPEAAGAWFKFENFENAVKKVLEVARKYANKN